MTTQLHEAEQYLQPALEDFIRNYFLLVYDVPVEFIPSLVIDEGKTIEGVIHILGGWNGSLTLHCTPEAAGTLAQTMFGTDEELPEEVVSDCIREMTNVIGGNLKALLGEGSVLSIPKAFLHEHSPQVQPETEEAMSVIFTFKGRRVTLTLHRSTLDIGECLSV